MYFLMLFEIGITLISISKSISSEALVERPRNVQRLERKLVEHKLMVLETVAPRPGNAEGKEIVLYPELKLREVCNKTAIIERY